MNIEDCKQLHCSKVLCYTTHWSHHRWLLTDINLKASAMGQSGSNSNTYRLWLEIVLHGVPLTSKPFQCLLFMQRIKVCHYLAAKVFVDCKKTYINLTTEQKMLYYFFKILSTPNILNLYHFKN